MLTHNITSHIECDDKPIEPIIDNYIESLRKLALSYKIHVTLDPYCAQNTEWPTSQLAHIHSMSYPLRSINMPRRWLSYWEIFTYCLRKSTVLSITSFIFDNDLFIDVVTRASHKLGLHFSYISNEQNDGTTASNMRIWGNKITLSAKPVNMIICANSDPDEVSHRILFSVMNLSVGGIAIIELPGGISPDIVWAVRVFSQYFKETTLCITMADDRTYLCGIGLAGVPDSAARKVIYAHIALGSSAAHQCSDSILIAFVTQSHDYRYCKYEKILKINDKLSRSASAQIFSRHIDAYLESEYQDRSAEWAAITEYTSDQVHTIKPDNY